MNGMRRDSNGAWRVRGDTSPVIVILLAGILIAIVALILVIALKDRDQPTKGATNPSVAEERESGSGAESKKPKAPVKEIKSGETVTRKELVDQGVKPTVPSKPADTKRIEQTYKPGSKYRSVVKGVMDARASAKEGGIKKVSNMHYVAEAEIIRTIESNDGTTIVLTQEFRKAQNITLSTKVEDIRIEPGLGGGFLSALWIGLGSIRGSRRDGRWCLSKWLSRCSQVML